ncbi:hypothetical protein EDD22DRAFT_464540 [Suillus occidentalis]|nr:hypothetical protein EDD22DRAFT_464540 [Suillus occidentalis]
MCSLIDSRPLTASSCARASISFYFPPAWMVRVTWLNIQPFSTHLFFVTRSFFCFTSGGVINIVRRQHGNRLSSFDR